MSDSVISRRVEDIDGLFDCLLEQHPEPVCELNFKSPFELLVAVILSAQCTDKRVNEVTSHIFDKYNTPKQFADMRQEDLERMIFSCGFYRNKAANIIAASKDIVDKFGGEVPSDFDSLLSLAGVGRKTANVVSAVAFGEQTMPVDTHVLRLSNRIGLDFRQACRGGEDARVYRPARQTYAGASSAHTSRQVYMHRARSALRQVRNYRLLQIFQRR